MPEMVEMEEVTIHELLQRHHKALDNHYQHIKAVESEVVPEILERLKDHYNHIVVVKDKVVPELLGRIEVLEAQVEQLKARLDEKDREGWLVANKEA